MEYPELKQQLDEIGNFIVEVFRAEIKANNKVASGNLLESIEYKVEFSEVAIKVQIFGANYFKYIVQGRKAGYPSGGDGSFLRNLIDWVRVRGLETDDKAVVSAAYAIRESIFQKGIPPVDLLEFAEQEIDKYVTQNLLDAINKDVERVLDDIIRFE